MSSNPSADYYQALCDIDTATRQINDANRAATDRHQETVTYWNEVREFGLQWNYDDPEWLHNLTGAANSTLSWAGVKQQPPYPPPVAHQPPRSWEELQALSAQFDQQIEANANMLRDAAQQYQRSRYVTAGTKTSLWVGAAITTVVLLCFGWGVIWMPVAGAIVLNRDGTDDTKRRLWTFLYPSAVVGLWLFSIFALFATPKIGIITGIILPGVIGAAITYVAFQQTTPDGANGGSAPPPPMIPTSRGAAPHGAPPGDHVVLSARQWGRPGGTVNIIDDGTNSGAVNAGLWGEQQTAALTTRIVADVPDLWVFHDLTIPNFPGPNVDHAAVRGNMLWLIDSKAWRAAVYVKQNDHMWRDGEQFPAGDTKTMLLAAQKYAQVSPPGTVIYPTVVVHATGGGQATITNHTPNDPVTYITADQLERLLTASPGQYPPHPPLLEAVLNNTMWRHPTPAP